MKLGTKKWILGIVILLVLGVMLGAIVEGAADIAKGATKEVTKVGKSVEKLGATLKTKFGGYGALIVNSLALIGVGLLVASFLSPADKTQKVAVYIGLGALGVILAWQFHINTTYAGKFLWEITLIRNFFHFKVVVNALIIVVITYFVAFEWLLKDKFNTTPGKVLIWVAIIVLALMVVRPDVKPGETYETMKPPYTYLWERESIAEYRFFFFGDSGCEFIRGGTDIEKEGETYYRQGNLWYRSDNDLPWVPEWDDKVDEGELKKELDTKLVNKTDEQKKDPKIRKEKYCYTEESVIEYIDKVKKGEKYVPAIKTLYEGDDYRGFGILRGTHLLMLAISFGLFWWTFQMFMKG